MILFALLAAQPAPLSAPAPQTAQPPATILVEPAAMLIAGCDADGDARVGRPELDACLARGFARAPGGTAAGLGYLAFADWAQTWLGDRNALPSPFEIDADNDDRITLAELQARFAQFFARFDANGDGVLTRAELVTIRASAPGSPDGRGRRRR